MNIPRRTLPLLFAFSIFSGYVWSQDPEPRMDDVVVTATRLSGDSFRVPYALYTHNRDELSSGVGRTALDRIDHGPGVIIQHTAPGQTSPYIRGLTGKQSLLLLDGVRLSHATMRGGPNEYAAFIPDMSLDGIDALLGSSGVVNGSDGLTGALNFRLATPGRMVKKPVSPWFGTRIDSANGVQTSSGVDGESGDWRYTIEGSSYDFHDTDSGKDAEDNYFGPNKNAYGGIPNTAYTQWAFAGRFAYDGFVNRSLEMSFGHTRQEDARRPDGYFENSNEPSRLSRYYDPESFSYVHLRDIWTPNAAFLDRFTTTVWWHQFDERQKREDITGGRYRRREYDDRTDSYGIEPQGLSRVGDHELVYGVLGLFEKTTNAYREFRTNAGRDPAQASAFNPNDWKNNTTITDGAEYNTQAVYLQDLWKINKQWDLLAGVRYTRVDWDFDVASKHAEDFTSSVRSSWHFHDNMLLFAGVSKAFRVPNLSDLDGATDRASSGTTRFGNPNLDPETGHTYEAGWRYERGHDTLAASVFHTRIEDNIQTIYPTGAGSATTGNGESAYLEGYELDWNYGLPVPEGFCERFAFVGSFTEIDSEQRVPMQTLSHLREPISRANRVYGKAGFRCDIDSHWWAKTQVRFHDKYSGADVAVGDATDVRFTIPGDNGDGSNPGYGVVDVSAGWTNDDGNRWATLTLENIADKTYRQLGSGADAPGHNVGLAAGVRF